MKKGFTLIELLAVIIILSIILIIAIPSVLNVISNATKASFESDAKMVLKSFEYKKFESETYDLTTINETNISDLNLSNVNYKSIYVTIENNKPRVVITGQNKWKNLVAYGTEDNLKVSNLPSGLVGYWKFDGNANDSSLYNNNGVVTGATLTTDRNGKINSAYLFDGTDDFVDVNTSLGLSNNYSISWWMKNNSLSLERHPIGLGSTTFQCYLSNGSSQLRLYDSIFSLNAGDIGMTWNFITIVAQSGVGTKMYSNGVLISSTPNVYTLPTSNLDIGRRNSSTYYYPGVIDNVRLYNRALTADEVILLYNID